MGPPFLYPSSCLRALPPNQSEYRCGNVCAESGFYFISRCKKYTIEHLSKSTGTFRNKQRNASTCRSVIHLNQPKLRPVDRRRLWLCALLPSLIFFSFLFLLLFNAIVVILAGPTDRYQDAVLTSTLDTISPSLTVSFQFAFSLFRAYSEYELELEDRSTDLTLNITRPSIQHDT